MPSEPDRVGLARAGSWRPRRSTRSIEKEDGIAPWLWERWRVLERAGLDRAAFVDDRRRLPARDLALADGGADLGPVLLGADRPDRPSPAARLSQSDGSHRAVSLGADCPALSLHGVRVVRDGRALFDDVDWEVGAGERWVILGPNGSGKTTLLRVAGARLWPTAAIGRGSRRAARPGRRADAATAGRAL